MNSAIRCEIKAFGITVLTLLGLLLTVHCAGAADGALYRRLPQDAFMKSWCVLKPIPVSRDAKQEPTEEVQKAAFARDWFGADANIRPLPGTEVTIDGKQFKWQLLVSTNDVVDLTQGSDPSEFAAAYAWAEIEMPRETKSCLGIGSDDAVKVWLNGKPLHEHWVARATHEDDDLVPVVLKPGKNALLLKIQNIKEGWGFTCRLLSQDRQAGKVISAIINSGDIESVQKFLASGIDINSRTKSGVTPWMAARLRGQTDVADFLASKGADTSGRVPPIPELVNALFTNAVKTNGPGAAVLVARNGKILFEKGYGLADVERHVPITPETKFRIGSITKQFTAAAILKLQEQGKLSVEDNLSKYFPEYPRGREVTLRHLLTHTSGIHNYTDKPGFMDSVTSPIKPDELVKSFENDPFDFDPGAKWQYCNSGFFLLGRIVEKVSGQTYEDFLRHTLFDPLGMKSTGVHHSDAALMHVALGYDGGPKRAVNWDMSRAGGAGALYSTVGDLYRWNEALFHGKVLSESSVAAAFKPVLTAENKNNNSDEGYGYGWAIGKLRGTQEIGHGGGLNGFVSYLLRLPEKNFTIVILANGAPGVSPPVFAHLSSELCLGTELAPRPKATKASPASLDLVTGRYDYGDAVLTVEREDTRLFAQLGAQNRYEIFPKSDLEYFWKVADARVEFVKGPDGKIVEATHHQNGNIIHAPRLDELKIVDVDPSTFDALVGTYRVGESDTVATVTRDGKRLFGQVTGQQKLQLLPRSETEFALREVNAQVTFVKDANGKVIKAKLLQAGQTTEANKTN